MATNDDSFGSEGFTVEYPSSIEPEKGDDVTRILMVTAAVVLLNLGLFFILVYIAALIAGFVAGYILQKRGHAIWSSFIGSFIGNMILFYMASDSLYAELLNSGMFEGIPIDMISSLFWTSMIFAAMLLSILGIIGAYIGNRMRPSNGGSKYPQSGGLE